MTDGTLYIQDLNPHMAFNERMVLQTQLVIWDWDNKSTPINVTDNKLLVLTKLEQEPQNLQVNAAQWLIFYLTDLRRNENK